MQNTTDTKLSAIDKALAAAKARKAAKDSSPPAPLDEVTEAAAPKAKKAEKPDGAKQQKAEALAASRAAAKAIRDAERQQRREAKAAAVKGPVHMKKIARAEERLPQFKSDAAARLFDEITTNMSAADITTMALRLQHFNRAKATERALDQRVAAGSSVRIVGGDPKYIGMTGVVDRAQRIRCYVNVPGVKRPVYLFTSDVTLIEVQADLAKAS